MQGKPIEARVAAVQKDLNLDLNGDIAAKIHAIQTDIGEMFPYPTACARSNRARALTRPWRRTLSSARERRSTWTEHTAHGLLAAPVFVFLVILFPVSSCYLPRPWGVPCVKESSKLCNFLISDICFFESSLSLPFSACSRRVSSAVNASAVTLLTVSADRCLVAW